MVRASLIIALTVPALMAGAAFAKDGSREKSKPNKTKTTQKCTAGQVWDRRSNSCVTTESHLLDDETLYQAVREFAYTGQLENAQNALRAMSDQTDDRVLTYWGFTHRRLGNMTKAMSYYEQALSKNPANITARSYMGQALIEQGDFVGARDQLFQIRALGGSGSWAEESLKTALLTGTTYNF